MPPYRSLIFICVCALLLRIGLLPYIQHPGIADPNHYYNLGVQLVEGHGFYIDYIWHYYNPPINIVHPDDFWMPGTASIAAISMKLFGVSVQAAILPFLLISVTVLPILAYLAAKQFGSTPTTSLLAAAAVAFLPEFVLNSLRTDTTIPNTICVCSSVLLLNYGLTYPSHRGLIGAGIMGGLAYLIRGDNLLLLPMLVVTVIVHTLWGHHKLRWLSVGMIPLIALLVVSPWLLRNLQEMGTLITPNLGRMFFFTEFNDHFAYEREFSLQTLFTQQTVGQIVGKRLFEMAASLKIMYTTLDVFLPVAVIGGSLLVIQHRDKKRLLTLAPTLILLVGTYFLYTILAPMGSQGGSFKKAYLSLIPLLIPLASYALERTVTERWLQIGTVIIVVGLMAANGFELVRADVRTTNNYLTQSKILVEHMESLPDTNGDGQVIFMSQDSFMFRFLGLRSVMIPNENRDKVLEVAQRYDVDYILMPADRRSLDPIYTETEIDSHFLLVMEIPEMQSKIFRFVLSAN